jgi:MFS family permease
MPDSEPEAAAAAAEGEGEGLAPAPPEGPEKGPPRLFTISFMTFVVMNFCVFSALDMMLATMPLYLQENGMSEARIGVVFGGVFLASISVRFFAGRLVDFIKPLWVLRLGFLLAALGNAVFLLFDNFLNYFASRIVFGLGMGLSSTMIITLASAVIPPGRTGEGLSILALGASIALTCGPFIGIEVRDHFGFTIMLSSVIGVFLVGAALAFSQREKYFRGKFVQMRRPPLMPGRNVAAAALLIFFLGLNNCSIFTYLVLYLDELDMAAAAKFFTVTAFAIILTRLFGGKIHDRQGHLFIVLPTSLLIILSELILLLVPGERSVLVAAVCFGLGMGALIPSLQTLAITAAPPEKRTAAAAAYLNGLDVGQALGIVLLGVISEIFHTYRWVYLVTPLFVVFLLLFYLMTPFFRQGKIIRASEAARP